MFIRMWKQLLLAKSWCVEEKYEIFMTFMLYLYIMNSMMKDSVVIGHLPRKILPVASLFLKKGERILCRTLATGMHVSQNIFNFSSY